MARSARIRRVVGAFLASATLLLPAACTPERWSMIALTQTDGQLMLLPSQCPDPLDGGVSVTRYVTDPGEDQPRAAEEWSLRVLPAAVTEPVTTPRQIVLLGPPPPGWQTDEDSLRELRDGTRYLASSARRGFAIEFRPENVRALRPGQVLIGTGRSDRFAIISDREFYDGTAKHCDD